MWPVSTWQHLMLISQSWLMIRPSTWVSANTGPSNPTTTGKDNKGVSSHTNNTQGWFNKNPFSNRYWLKLQSRGWAVVDFILKNLSQSWGQSGEALYSLSVIEKQQMKTSVHIFFCVCAVISVSVIKGVLVLIEIWRQKQSCWMFSFYSFTWKNHSAIYVLGPQTCYMWTVGFSHCLWSFLINLINCKWDLPTTHSKCHNNLCLLIADI